MPLSKYTLIQYNGTDVGALYLEDIQQRSQLGAGRQRIIGQDIVINSGDVIGVVNTGEVLMSEEKGILKRFSTENDHGVAEAVEAAGGEVFYDVNGNPTGLAAPLTLTGVDSIEGLTGTQELTRSGTVGTKDDPSVTVGDF